MKNIPKRLCLLCDRPFKKVNKSKVCPLCNKKLNEIGERLGLSYKYYKKKSYHKFSSKMAISIRNILKLNDFWGSIKKKPSLLNYRFRINSEMKKLYGNSSRITRKIKPFYSSNDPISGYILNAFDKQPHLKVLYVYGDAFNPTIHYKDTETKKEYNISWNRVGKKNSLPKRISTISSGELTVANFLSSMGIAYTTQYETLKCINPETGFQLPYDFEISGLKIVIEVQGEQHYRYTPTFHENIDDFHRQQRRDKVKKQFAESSGYTFIEITYPEIANKSYMRKIVDVVDRKKKC